MIGVDLKSRAILLPEMIRNGHIDTMIKQRLEVRPLHCTFKVDLIVLEQEARENCKDSEDTMVEGSTTNEKNKKGFRDSKLNGSDQRTWSYSRVSRHFTPTQCSVVTNFKKSNPFLWQGPQDCFEKQTWNTPKIWSNERVCQNNEGHTEWSVWRIWEQPITKCDEQTR